jgi:cytochrome c-type biogenesis protein CcsB
VTDTLSQFSVLSLYSAMAVYAIAFIVFTFDLARGAGREANAAAASDSIVQSTGEGSTATLTRVRADAATRSTSRGRLARIAMALTWLGFLFQLVATVLRGVAASRVPWANMYEFAMTGTLIITLVFLIVNLKWDLAFVGAFSTGLVLLLLGLSATRYYVEVVPLPPALQSYWLVIHVFVATLGTGFFALGFALSLTQLLQTRREHRTVDAKPTRLAWMSRLPDSAQLENYAYRLIIIGFIFWTFTLIAGAVWADKAWGRYWGWDTKEVWTFIIWTIYAGYIHARSTRGWRGTRSAVLAMVGFGSVMFNFTVVNIYFKGLHAYSGLS